MKVNRMRAKSLYDYDKEIVRFIDRVCTPDADGRSAKYGHTTVLFLDRRPPLKGGILQTSIMIDQNMHWDIPYSKLYIVPEITAEKIKDYPFSYQFVATSVFNKIMY